MAARRRLLRLLRRSAHRGLAAVALVAVAAGTGVAQVITEAAYVEPTDRYPHGVLGDAIEHATLRVTFSDGRQASVRWPDTIVFEDISPRLVDLDGDGAPEVIVVESHERRGARLAVYAANAGRLRLSASTPFIGTRFRWLAPVGAADLDGDGAIEIAYVDRPHLAKTLRIWRYGRDGAGVELAPVAEVAGVTNHRIGEVDIAGGIRSCDEVPEMIVASADWTRLVAVRLQDGRLTQRDIGPHRNRSSFDRAMSCAN